VERYGRFSFSDGGEAGTIYSVGDLIVSIKAENSRKASSYMLWRLEEYAFVVLMAIGAEPMRTAGGCVTN
jgi:hypothetical protein